MKQLPTYEVRDDIFDKILYELRYRVKQVSEEFFGELIYGYKEKNVIYYEKCADGNEYLICKESVLNYYTDQLPYCTSWKQCRIRKVINTKNTIQHTITGSYAYNMLMKILSDFYTKAEIDSILKNHSAVYDETLKQVHINVNACDKGKIYRFANCYKYDINGAHCAALVEMFPKAEKRLIKLYEERKIKPENKQLFNYAVGYLVKRGYRETYNWIVQRTTKKLNEAIKLTNGYLLYANTDGFIVQDPNNLIVGTKTLDDFKEEYKGDVYFYLGNNYNLYQFGDEMTGSCRTTVRDKIDLRVGKVIEYKNVRIYDEDDKTKFTLIVDNIEKKEVDIYEA
jgi:hypothetical protein